jgi:hypothetical protein
VTATRRFLWVLLVVTGTVLAAGCGDDDGAGTTTAAGATDTTDDVTGPEDLETGPVTETALESCLTAGGLEPEDDNDAIAFGVEDRYRKIRVELDAEGDPSVELAAELYVFESPAQAEANRPTITLQAEDTERNRVVENVVLSYTIIPSYDPEGAETVEGCLNGAS